MDLFWIGDSIISRFVIITVANGSSHKQFKVRVGDLDELRGWRMEDAVDFCPALERAWSMMSRPHNTTVNNLQVV